MTVSIIAAVARNRAIGNDNKLIYWLPDDLKRFKSLTTGHTIIMGRRTFESLPKGALPGRENIVVSRNTDFVAEGAVVCHSIDEALERASMPGERFVLGGAQLYAATINRVDTLHLTALHASFPDADVFFPAINADEWTEVDCEHHPSDERNPYAYSFVTLKRK